MNVQSLIDELNKLAELQAETNRLTAQIPHADEDERRAIAQRLKQMWTELPVKQIEGDRT